MNSDVKEIRKVTKEFSILYVEDEPDVREMVGKLLKALFDNVYIEENGKNGLEFFEKHIPDIVMTDIRMPLMDGLEMSREIKKRSSKTPIIITTAFNDEKYFMKSIDIGIDKYIIKPIIAESLFESVFTIAKRLKNEKELENFKRQSIENKLNNVSHSVVSNIISALPNPVITYKNAQVLFTNTVFLELLNTEDIDSLNEDNQFDFNKLLEDRKGFLSNLEEYDENDIASNKISIKHKYGHQIFLLNKRVIGIGGEKEFIELYSLNNISLQEYQKNKLKRYSEILEEFIFKGHKSKIVKSDSKSEEIAHVEKEEEADLHKLSIDAGQMASLRKSHAYKTVASDYIAELDVETLQDMQELDELENEISELLIVASDSESTGDFYLEIADKLHHYAQTIQILIEFDELSYAIESFSDLLIENYLKLDDKMHRRLFQFIKNFLEDLITWRQTIFVTQSTIDIHYLDSSLLSAILQVEILLRPDVNEIDDEENEDLILF